MSAKKTISFLDLYIKYCERSFDREKTVKLVNYFLEKSGLIVAAIKFNHILYEEFFMETRGILREIELDIFKGNVPIYYVEFPYDNNTLKQISFQDFLSHIHDFFAEKGQPSQGSMRSIRLEFDLKILSILSAKNQSSDLEHPRYHYNNHNQNVDELYRLVKTNQQNIFRKYGKAYKDLTKDEFRTFIETDLQKRNAYGQHVIDHLWYRTRND